jgi:hypothetical protein
LTPIVDGLPQDPRERRGLLDNYFSRRLAEARLSADGRWHIELAPFDDVQMHVDPQLADGLRPWGIDDVTQIPDAVRATEGSQLSLDDSWTAVAWSRWLRQSAAGEVTILHVDDHDDLMAPLLAIRDDGRFDDLVSGQLVDLRVPDTVEAAVESAAIGVAGFFTPLMHTLPGGHVRHLCASGYAQTRPGRMHVRRTQRRDELLRPGAPRPAVCLEPVGGLRPAWTYEVTDDPERWLADLPPGPLLLHVDFDYFCNRFNGDSDWQTVPPQNSVGDVTVRARVDALCATLDRSDAVERIEDVTGALSPGFFPASLWSSTLDRLRRGLDGAGLSVDAWRLT